MANLKGAIIGYGFIASKGHFPAYMRRKDVQIVAICDKEIRKIEMIPPDVRKYDNYEDLFLNEKDLDFVDIATNASSHYEIMLSAISNNVNILCEKPITSTEQEIADIISKAKDKKLTVFPCHNYKHAPVVKAIREIITSGKIGEVKSATLQTFRNTHAIGAKHWLPDWRRNFNLSGGGIAMDHGSHSLYLIFEWLGGYPTSISASSFNLSKGKFDTEDNFTASLTFQNGIANMHLTWTAGVRKVIYSIQGSKGAITINDNDLELAIMKNVHDECSSHKAAWDVEKYDISSNWMDSSHVEWFNSMFDQFVNCLKDKSKVNTELIDAYNCVLTINKAYESAKNNSSIIEIKPKINL